MYNGLAMMLLSLHPRFAKHRFAGPAIICGGVVFSGSIWCLVLAKERYVALNCALFPSSKTHIGMSRLRLLGPATPLGGMVMIAG